MANLSDPKKVAHNTVAELTLPKPGALTESEQLLEHSKLVREFMEAMEGAKNQAAQLRGYPLQFMDSVKKQLSEYDPSNEARANSFPPLFSGQGFTAFIWEHTLLDNCWGETLRRLPLKQSEDEWKDCLKTLCDDRSALGALLRNTLSNKPMVGAILVLAKKSLADCEWAQEIFTNADKTLKYINVFFSSIIERLTDEDDEAKHFLGVVKSDIELLVLESLYASSILSVAKRHEDDPNFKIIVGVHYPVEPATKQSGRYKSNFRENASNQFVETLEETGYSPKYLKTDLDRRNLRRKFLDTLESGTAPLPSEITFEQALTFVKEHSHYWRELSVACKGQSFRKRNAVEISNSRITFVLRPEAEEKGQARMGLKLIGKGSPFQEFSLRVDLDPQYGIGLDFGGMNFEDSWKHRAGQSPIEDESLDKRLSRTALILGSLGNYFGTRRDWPLGHHIGADIPEVFQKLEATETGTFKKVIQSIRTALLTSSVA